MAVKLDKSCPECGTQVSSLASRCKQCGTGLLARGDGAGARAAAPVALAVSAEVAVAPPVAVPVVDSEAAIKLRAAAARRAETQQEQAAPPAWRTPAVIAGVAVAAGVVAWLLVRDAASAERGTLASATRASGKPAPLPPLDPADQRAQVPDPVDPFANSAPFAPGAPAPSLPTNPPPGLGGGLGQLPPGFPDPFAGAGGPFGNLPGLPSLKDLMQQTRSGLGGPPPDPAALQFADKAFALLCDKAAQCGLVDPGDAMSCEMLSQGLMSGALAQAMAPSSGGCKFDPTKAAQCLSLLQGIDCGAGAGGGGMGGGGFGSGDPLQIMMLLQQAQGCAEAFACM